jgi:hypothetical protein
VLARRHGNWIGTRTTTGIYGVLHILLQDSRCKRDSLRSSCFYGGIRNVKIGCDFLAKALAYLLLY